MCAGAGLVVYNTISVYLSYVFVQCHTVEARKSDSVLYIGLSMVHLFSFVFLWFACTLQLVEMAQS